MLKILVFNSVFVVHMIYISSVKPFLESDSIISHFNKNIRYKGINSLTP
jgi:hypothetical protein